MASLLLFLQAMFRRQPGCEEQEEAQSAEDAATAIRKPREHKGEKVQTLSSLNEVFRRAEEQAWKMEECSSLL